MSHQTKLHLYGIMISKYKQPQITIYITTTQFCPSYPSHTIPMCHHTMLWRPLFFWSLWPCHISCTYKQWDVIIKIHRSSCKALFLSNFNQTLFCSTVLVKIPNIKFLQPSGQWELSLQDRQTDRTIITIALCSCFSKTTKMNHGLENVSKG